MLACRKLDGKSCLRFLTISPCLHHHIVSHRSEDCLLLSKVQLLNQILNSCSHKVFSSPTSFFLSLLLWSHITVKAEKSLRVSRLSLSASPCASSRKLAPLRSNKSHSLTFHLESMPSLGMTRTTQTHQLVISKGLAMFSFHWLLGSWRKMVSRYSSAHHILACRRKRASRLASVCSAFSSLHIHAQPTI